MKYSIWDVAKKAGVSKSTVSRVLNGEAVSERSYKKVMDAVSEMGYRPNYMARGLRTSTDRVIGVLSLGGIMFSDPSLCARFAGITDVLRSRNYDLFLVHDDYENFNGITVPKYAKYLAENRINGVITLGATDKIEEQIKNASISFRNVVYTGERILPDKGFRVYLGNYNYSYDLFKQLLEKGHKKILMAYQDDNTVLIEKRKVAFKDVCSALGIREDKASCEFYNPYIDIEPDYVFKTSEMQEKIYNAYVKGGYTALFADESVDTRGILMTFAGHGLVPGRDYSIVTIEGGMDGEMVRNTKITSVHLPDYDYGKKIAELMIEVIENPELEYKDIYMSYSLTKGNSVKKI